MPTRFEQCIREEQRVRQIEGKVAVVTGGAHGIGRGIVEALLERRARVVVADIEAPVLDAAVAELSGRGEVRGVVTDVSDAESVEALAADVFDRYGACHLLFNNAGVSSGGGGLPWEQEANDWKWCFGVNVFGVANGVMSFVPRMIQSDEEGVIVNTSSGDGGIAPVPFASVYAASKAAVSCLTESVAHQLRATGTKLRAAVFYPSGGLLDTGLWTAARNRPPDLERVKPRALAPTTTFAGYKAALEQAGHDVTVADLAELGRFVLDEIAAGKYVIGRDLDRSADLLHRRADAIARGDLPLAMHEELL
jgi:NAD(P)-dependent dehydrogenase (short-subunit alcohol dehydrogenase family)